MKMSFGTSSHPFEREVCLQRKGMARLKLLEPNRQGRNVGKQEQSGW